MAENKNSFILYCDLIHTITHLTDEQAGKVFKHLLEYVNDKNPTTDDVVTKVAFEPIRQSLKRDLKKYEETRVGKSNAGILGNLKRYQPDLYDAVISEDMSLEEAQEVAKSRKVSQSDTELAVSVSVSDILYMCEISNLTYDEYLKDNPDTNEKHYWICQNIYAKIKANFENSDIKIMEELTIPKALDEIDKLYRLDKITNAMMTKIVLAIKYKTFYAENILSINSLRKKSKGSDLKKYEHLLLSYDKSKNENMKNLYSKVLNHLNDYDNTRS